jgi:hypothetical protein
MKRIIVIVQSIFVLLYDCRLLLPRFAVICGVLALTTGKVPYMLGRLPMRIKYEAVVFAVARYFD